jgi:hypothetical protein
MVWQDGKEEDQVNIGSLPREWAFLHRVTELEMLHKHGLEMGTTFFFVNF